MSSHKTGKSSCGDSRSPLKRALTDPLQEAEECDFEDVGVERVTDFDLK